MIPVTDIIPTRTAPIATIGLIVLTIVVSLATIRDHVLELAINMLYLWLFGWTVEDRLGRGRFAALYAFCATSAFVLQQLWLPVEGTSVIGGGVAGVIGAYLALYPAAKVLVLVPVPPLLVEVPAVFLMSLWLFLQIAWSVLAFAPYGLTDLKSLLVAPFVLRRRERTKVEWWSP